MADNQTFLERVMARSNLSTVNQAQVATNVVFRILRDMLTPETADRVSDELHKEEPSADMELKDLWKDTNPMVSFFSRLSPIRPLKQSAGVFKTRLDQEAALPDQADPERVAKAVFSATQEELSPERNAEIASYLPEDVRQMWEHAEDVMAK